MTSTVVTQSRTQLDSHADTYTINRSAQLTHIYETKVNVSPYDATPRSVNDLDAVNATVTHDYLVTNKIIIFNINQAIYINTMSNSLLYVM